MLSGKCQIANVVYRVVLLVFLCYTPPLLLPVHVDTLCVSLYSLSTFIFSAVIFFSLSFACTSGKMNVRLSQKQDTDASQFTPIGMASRDSLTGKYHAWEINIKTL